MTKTTRTPPVVTVNSPIHTKDADLSREVVRDKRGRRITERSVERLVKQARVGRPSLADGGASVQVAFRVPVALREQTEAIARQQGKSVSEFVRDALVAQLSLSSAPGTHVTTKAVPSKAKTPAKPTRKPTSRKQVAAQSPTKSAAAVTTPRGAAASSVTKSSKVRKPTRSKQVTHG